MQRNTSSTPPCVGTSTPGFTETLHCVNCDSPHGLHPEVVYVLGDNDCDSENVIAVKAPDRGLAERIIPDPDIVALRGGNRGTEIVRVFSCEFCAELSVFIDSFHKGAVYTRSLTLRYEG